jgi:anti-sigma factor RsiW
MSCTQMRELISALLDEEITPEENELLQSHLSTCQDCRNILSSYQNIGVQLRSYPVLEPDPSMRRKVMNTVAGKAKRRGAFAWPFGARIATAAFAVVFVAAGLLYVSQQTFLGPAASPTVAQNTGQTINIPTNAVVRIRFDRSMDAASVEKSVKVEPNVPLVMKWEDNTLSVKPAEDLQAGTVYTITVTDNAKDKMGNKLSEPVQVALKAVDTDSRSSSETAISTEPNGTSSTDTPSPTATADNSQTVAQVTGPIKAEVIVQPVPDSGVQVAEQVPTATSAPTTAGPTKTGTKTPAGKTPTRTASPAQTSASASIAGADLTPTGSVSATASETPTAGQTPTIAPSQTVAVTATVNPSPSAGIAAAKPFQSLYANRSGEMKALGAPTDQEVAMDLYVQHFEHGLMLQAKGTTIVYVITADGAWNQYDLSTLTQVVPTQSPAMNQTPAQPSAQPTIVPTSLIEPEGDFETVWNSVTGLKDLLGWAVEERYGSFGLMQDFENGRAVDTGANSIYALYSSGQAILLAGTEQPDPETLAATPTPTPDSTPTAQGTPSEQPAPPPADTVTNTSSMTVTIAPTPAP